MAMKSLARFAGRKVGILGMARSGLAAGRVLAAAGADVLAWDDQPGPLAEAARFGARAGTAADIPSLAALVASPGVPLTHPAPHPVIAAAQAAGVEVTCDIELFADGLGPRPLLAITGTNGKSTTSALAHHLLRAAGRDAVLGGNIGKAVFELDPGPEDRIVVLELSSFQLDLCARLHPRVACWLNLTPDHLDRHGDLDGYIAAKRRIFRNQGAGDTAVIGVDDAPSAAVLAGLARPRTVAVSVERRLAAGVYVEQGRLYDATGSAPVAVADLTGLPTLRGAHNHQNVAVAYGAVRALGLAAEEAVAGLASFAGLAHRMEEVARAGRVVWINDSKATNPDSATKSLGCFDNLFWIAGGKPKPGGFRSLRPYLGAVREAYAIGQAADALAADLGDLVPVHRSGTLDAALSAASDAAEASGLEPAVVLLAPACASFDQFRSFEHRGDVFRSLARARAGDARTAA
ncbi:MAG: UDP-N-acetylmuramoyl-L-alanine--D-glutamate ligase [Geminicoccaceae bacterium]